VPSVWLGIIDLPNGGKKEMMLRVCVIATSAVVAVASISSTEAASRKHRKVTGLTHYVMQGHYRDLGSQWVGEFSIGAAGACQGGGNVGIDKAFFDGPKPSVRCPNGAQLQRFDPKPGT
jgi:hypothetical protein